MNNQLYSIIRRYGVAVVSISLAVLLRLLLEPLLEGNAPLLSFTLAIMLSAWYGGLGPGIFATILGILAGAYLFLEPIYSLDIESPIHQARVVLFSAVGVFISILCESLRRAKDRAESDTLRARESEEQFCTLANSIPQLAWMAHADGFIFWYNRRWFDYTGMTPGQMEGWGWQLVHNPDTLPRVMERWQKAIATGERFEMEFPLRGFDGNFRTFLTRVEPIKDSSGAVVRWFGTNTDVHELKRVEDSLRETQARLTSTLEAGSVGTWIWDITNDRVFADENLGRMFSIKSEDAAAGKPFKFFAEAIYKDDFAHVTTAISDTIRTGQAYEAEYRLRSEDGQVLWVQARGRTEYDEAGTAVRLIGVLVDITQRKRAEERLLASEERYRILFEFAPEGVAVFDSDGCFLDTNASLGKLLGYSRDELIGLHGSNVLVPAEIPHIEPGLTALKAGKEFRREMIFRRKDKSTFEAEVSATALPDGTILCVVHDITERKRAEKAIRNSTERLRALSARLQAAREEESTRIAREIHDELGQALTGIIIEMSWLEEQIFERGGGTDLIAKIRGSIKIAAEMVDTVRRIATELRPGLLDDFGLTAAVEWQAQEFEKRTGIKCDLKLNASPINLARQISTTLFRILQESLTNVARHARAERVYIELTETENTLNMSVADNGRGATEEELGALRSLGVLGMRERALLLGGEVRIIGQPGEGTRVEVSVPLAGESPEKSDYDGLEVNRYD